MSGLRPLDFIWLILIFIIVAQQLVVRRGQFDPIAFAAMAYFAGMIAATRVDRKVQNGERSPSAAVRQIIRGYLDDTENK